MVVHGFFSPYIQNDGRCTFCSESPLNPFPENRIITSLHIVERVMLAEVSCLKFCMLYFLLSVFLSQCAALSGNTSLITMGSKFSSLMSVVCAMLFRSFDSTVCLRLKGSPLFNQIKVN